MTSRSSFSHKNTGDIPVKSYSGSHFNDAGGSFESTLFDGHDVVPAEVQALEVGQPVEEAESRDPDDLVVVQQQPAK